MTEGLFYSLKVTTYLLQRFTALSDLIFDCYAGLYGYNDRVLLTESKFIPYTVRMARYHNFGFGTIPECSTSVSIP